nr:hypothetical protein [Bacillus aquiflavi]
MPLSSIILSFFILKEEILLYHILGISLVIGAICFISFDTSDKKSTASTS